MDGILKKYHPELAVSAEPPTDDSISGGQGQTESQSHEPQRTLPKKPTGKKSGGTGMNPVPPSCRQAQATTLTTRPQEPPQEVTANEPV